jgi:ADP-ribose pyrophosphatase
VSDGLANEPGEALAGPSRAQATPAAPGPLVADEAHLIERLVTSEQVFHGKLLDVRRDTVALHGNQSATREYVVHPGAVMVVPILDDGRLVMERQFRYPLARVLLEFPAGKIDAGESTAQCAVRELAEETGYRAGLWARACVIHNACAYSTEAIEIWFARELTLGERGLDDGELLDLVVLSEAELDSRAGSGEVTDVKTLIGLQWLQKWRAGTWALDWRALSAGGGAPIIASS